MLMALVMVTSHHWKLIQNYGVTISKTPADSCIKVCISYLSSRRLQDIHRLDRSQKCPVPAELWACGVI